MSTNIIRCSRCRRRCRNVDNNAWNVEWIASYAVGSICPECQTPEEDLEAQVSEAIDDYSTWRGERAADEWLEIDEDDAPRTEENTDDDLSPEEIEHVAATASAILRRRVEDLEQARDEQPSRLAEARARADQARTDALTAEPWDDFWTAVPTVGNGELIGMFGVPSILAKEMFGTRLAFEALDAGDDEDKLDDILGRFFTMVHGDPGQAFLIFSAALRILVTLVVPQLLEEIEHRASNYDARVMLAEAVWKAWEGRVNDLLGQDDMTGEPDE
jgi:hypothetical protein